MYQCKACGKEFPEVAWIESWTITYPNITVPSTGYMGSAQTSTTVKKPCCPFCLQLEIEEIVEKDELWEEFKKEFLKAIKEKAIKEKLLAVKKS
jgi:hypothetical protein